MEDNWNLISASAFNLSQYVVLTDVCEKKKNPDSSRYIIRKGWNLTIP